MAATADSRLLSDPQDLPLPSTRGMNTSGLPILPDELLLEIMASHPAPPLPVDGFGFDYIEPSTTRHEMLLALSQTCSNLRRFFRPYVWERLEVSSYMRVNGKGLRLHPGGEPENRKINLELLRRLGIVTICDPGLALFVNVINVQVMGVSGDSILSELARCMTLFPNLHTVKLAISFPHTAPRDTPAQIAFQAYKYPHIRHLLLDETTKPLMLSCPNARSIHGRLSRELLSYPNYREYVLATALEAVGFQFDAYNNPEFHLFPNLRIVFCKMVFYHSIATNTKVHDFFRALSGLPRLKIIKASIPPDRLGIRYGGLTTEEIINRLKKILLDVQRVDHEDKTIVYTLDGELPGEAMDHVIHLPFSGNAK